jgi:cobalt-zinc-cadmium efflux system protein
MGNFYQDTQNGIKVMSHGHDHAHHHQPVELTNVNKAFIIGIALNFLFVIIEAVVGFSVHSLSLLSDAGHNLADVGSLALSLLAFRLLKVKANDKYTYGYRKTSILAAFFNAVILLISIGAITYGAIHRFIHPEPLPGRTIAIVAGIGILINAFTAIQFIREKEKDINVKSAYLHLMADALVSVGLVIGGLVIFYTHWFWLDPVLSLIIAIVILFGTWSLLRESLRLSLDGVPKGIDLQQIKKAASGIQGLIDIHHIHVWAISTTQNAMTAHLVLSANISKPEEVAIKSKLRHEMEHMNIQHVTLETEWVEEDCKEKDC